MAKDFQTDNEKRVAIKKIVDAQAVIRDLSRDNQVPLSLRMELAMASDKLFNAMVAACDIPVRTMADRTAEQRALRVEG